MALFFLVDKLNFYVSMLYYLNFHIVSIKEVNLAATYNKEILTNKIEVKAKSLNQIFKGYVEPYKGKKSNLVLHCKIHGDWKSSIGTTYLNSKYGCPSCAKEFLSSVNKSEKGKESSRQNGKKRKEDDEVLIKKFMASGSFLTGTIFKRSEKTSSRGFNSYWEYTCPSCSNDEYVHNGLCSGVFTSFGGHLREGKLTCRCSKVYRWSCEQREYQINKRINFENLNYKFISWEMSGRQGYKANFIYSCALHGNQRSNITRFLDQKSGCPVCSVDNQIYSYINIVYDQNTEICLKYGITNNVESRLCDLNRRNIFQNKNLFIFIFENNKSCKEAEQNCKKLSNPSLSRKELKDGYTETTSIQNLDDLIQIMLSSGGKQIV